MTPSTLPGDAALVFDRLRYAIANPPSQDDAIDVALTEVSAHINELHAEIARLRELEALEAQAHKEWCERALKAEARVKELEEALRRAVRWAEDSGRTELWVTNARRALAHEEEA